jgi:hypothetical protein
MENAEKKKPQHTQPILLCRQRKGPPRREGRRKMEAGGRIRVGKRAGEEERRRRSMDGRRFPPEH